MSDPQHRRSRVGWEIRTAPTTTPAGTHDHAQRNGPLAVAFLCIIALFLAVAALLWFIVARGETRDAREQNMRQEIRQEVCRLLGMAPADDPQADLYRAELRCTEPGRVTPAPPPEPASPSDPAVPPGAAPAAPGPSAAAPPPAAQPPADEPAPRLLEPLTDPICATLGACL